MRLEVPGCPVVVDSMENSSNAAYGAYFDRLYILQGGKIVYQGGRGPEGYRISELRDWLDRYRASLDHPNHRSHEPSVYWKSCNPCESHNVDDLQGLQIRVVTQWRRGRAPGPLTCAEPDDYAETSCAEQHLVRCFGSLFPLPLHGAIIHRQPWRPEQLPPARRFMERYL
ncbi:hypothetical protein F2P81_003446 [Scophthalmus maximus]|uniref:Iodothyronine deiodinase n=1 Tax=Scophthalmus maximus TaxID=52904 RepID=A0A6A4TIG6_SCOMX|nr:hypothetical protein F2P81_003446 [Scophthalmus maximus]